MSLRCEGALPHRIRCSADVREIDAGAPSLRTRRADRLGTPGHSFVERTKGLIEQALIILDEIGAAANELSRELCEVSRRSTQRFQDSADQGPISDPNGLPETSQPVARPAPGRDEALCQREKQQAHVTPQTARSEQHVKKSATVGSEQAGGIVNGGLVASTGTPLEMLKAAEDVAAKRRGQNIGVGFNGLIQTDALR
jgi:hypothetical protein